MTHGEEPGTETHQDSAVLTYLEGLLMHPVATGPSATATRRSEAGHGNEEPGNKMAGSLQLPTHGSGPREKSGAPVAGTQHLKKARLLRCGAWGEAEGQRPSAPAAEVNGPGREHRTDAVDGSPQGESTLLASLLQSFSSRLQSVAMSQQAAHGHKQADGPAGEGSAPAREDAFPGYGTASSRLKGLMRKSKQQNHHSVPYSRRGGQDQQPESPRAAQASAPDSVSCAERLKAVANLVKIRSSPTPSPKPSVACSQLALLLSSEAHLQQYSREQALKAQLSGRSASERLAIMATQQTQDKRPPSMGEPLMAPDALSSLNAQNGTLPPAALNSSKRSPCLTPALQSRAVGSPLRTTPQTPKEKRPFDRQGGRPPQNCSSLLLLLLNNHHSQRQLTANGHLEEDCGALPSLGSSLQSDSELSNTENSLAKDGSDAESSYSSCSPIDLSVRSRVSSRESAPCSSASSLDKLTESMINKWKPEAQRPKFPDAGELEISPGMKSHHKVTLMQLLLDRRNNDKVNTTVDNPDVWHDAALGNMPAGPLEPIGMCGEEGRTRSPLERRAGQVLPTFSLGRDASSTRSPHVQSSPLDLCKSKSYTNEKVAEPAFSASKLLQNLAQCGVQNASPSPPMQAHRPPSIRQSPELELDRPLTLLDRLSAPTQRNKTPVSEGPPATFTPFGRESSPPAPTQIENLLERRTVLQLLLGTASHKEKSSGRRSAEVAGGCLEKGASVICDGSNGPSPDVKIKTEPGEQSLLSDSSDDGTRRRKWGGYERHSPLSEPRESVKTEPCATETIAKYGLLSQLLKQQTTSYHASTQVERHSSSPFTPPPVKEARQDYQSPLPKKRKLCMELAERLSGELCQRSTEAGSDRLLSGTPEERDGRRLLSPKEEDAPIRSPAAGKALPRDSQGFNVLKQLLLSDNCLKELSQPRGAPSPCLPPLNCNANGNFLSQAGYNHELANLPWYPHSLGSGPGHLKPRSSPTAANSSHGSPWGQASPKRTPTHVKAESESPAEWVLSGEERSVSSPDSPRLTRSNPILYYMLQRGNGQLRPDTRDQGEMTTPFGLNLKDEPCADVRDYDHRLSSTQRSHPHGDERGNSGGQFNGSLGKW